MFNADILKTSGENHRDWSSNQLISWETSTAVRRLLSEATNYNPLDVHNSFRPCNTLCQVRFWCVMYFCVCTLDKHSATTAGLTTCMQCFLTSSWRLKVDPSGYPRDCKVNCKFLTLQCCEKTCRQLKLQCILYCEHDYCIVECIYHHSWVGLLGE